MTHGDFLHPVERAIVQSTLAPRDGIVVVAVSGGADSMALVEELRARYRYIVVAHFDHRLRENSERDAEHVAAYAHERGLEFVLGVWRRRAKPASMEQAARDARYGFLASIAEGYGASSIATAHTQSDQVETILMRILRGAGRVGLAGIPERRGLIVRPLLGVTRADTRDYCEARGIAFVDDPTNDDVRFFRNRIRHEILPSLRAAIPSIDDHLLRVADRARREQLAFAERFDLGDIVREEEPGSWALLLGPFERLDDEEATALLRDALASVGLARDVGRVHYRRLLELVRNEHAGSSADLPGVHAHREHDALVFSKSCVFRPRVSQPIRIPGSTRVGEWVVEADYVSADDARLAVASCRHADVAYFDADAIAGTLVARSPRPGDRMRPFGLRGHKKLSDLFVDRKIPRRYRERALIIEGESIHWVAGLARGDDGRIGEATERVLRLKATRP